MPIAVIMPKFEMTQETGTVGSWLKAEGDFVRKGELAIEHDIRVETFGRETKTYSYRISDSIRSNAQIIDEKLADIRGGK